MFLRNAILPAALLLCALPAAANAGTQRIEVKTSDLNLATEAGRALLHQRIARAADDVCGAYHGLATAKAPAYAACTSAVQARAMPQYEAMVAAAQDAQKIANSRKDVPSLH